MWHYYHHCLTIDVSIFLFKMFLLSNLCVKERVTCTSPNTEKPTASEWCSDSEWWRVCMSSISVLLPTICAKRSVTTSGDEKSGQSIFVPNKQRRQTTANSRERQQSTQLLLCHNVPHGLFLLCVVCHRHKTKQLPLKMSHVQRIARRLLKRDLLV